MRGEENPLRTEIHYLRSELLLLFERELAHVVALCQESETFFELTWCSVLHLFGELGPAVGTVVCVPLEYLLIFFGREGSVVGRRH